MSLTPISQKAHDISFATFRCATLFKNKKLRTEIEDAATELLAELDSLQTTNYELKTAGPADKLERLISFAESIGEMKPVNASVLKRELGNLHTAIDFHLNTFKGNPSGKNNQDIDISSMFSGSVLPSNLSLRTKAKQSNSSNDSENNETNGNSSEPTIRQTAILRKIRETEFCRLRNLVESMPNISERTIRNDIQSLIEKNLIRRVGGGGPSSYFETMELAITDRSKSFAV